MYETILLAVTTASVIMFLVTIYRNGVLLSKGEAEFKYYTKVTSELYAEIEQLRVENQIMKMKLGIKEKDNEKKTEKEGL